MLSAKKIQNILAGCKYTETPLLLKITEYLPLHSFPNTEQNILNTIASESFVIDEHITKITITFVNEEISSKIPLIEKVLNYFLKNNNSFIFYIFRYLLLCEKNCLEKKFSFDTKNILGSKNLLVESVTDCFDKFICSCIFSEEPFVGYKFDKLPQDCSDFFYHNGCKKKKVCLGNEFYADLCKDEFIFFVNEKEFQIKNKVIYCENKKHSGMTYMFGKGISLENVYNYYFG